MPLLSVAPVLLIVVAVPEAQNVMVCFNMGLPEASRSIKTAVSVLLLFAGALLGLTTKLDVAVLTGPGTNCTEAFSTMLLALNETVTASV